METLLYGIPKGETERYTEELLSTNASTEAQIEAVKAAASKDGFHSFRIAYFTPGEKVDFAGAVNVK